MTAELPQTAAEKRSYARGYNAGRKRVEADQAQWEATHRAIVSDTTRRRDAFYAAALTGLIMNSGWQMNGKRVTDMVGYCELARQFADESMRIAPSKAF